MIHISEPCIGSLEREYVDLALRNNSITQGDFVLDFENGLARHLSVPEGGVVALSSGTTALHLALAALGIGPGDEVLVPDLTFVATANAVSYTGATPVLVDVDPRTWCIDPIQAADKITNRTVAIIPVHLYGVACDMYEINRLAERHHLHVIEDAAEGLGGDYYDRPLGTHGKLGAFSFYGNKVITTGEGGALVTEDLDLAERLRHLRGHAHVRARRYFHSELGFNYRMTDIQAAVGYAQLRHLQGLLERRNEIFRLYQEQIGHLPGSFVPKHSKQAPWLYTVHLPAGTDRGFIEQHLLVEKGIETRPTFVPLHMLPMYVEKTESYPAATSIWHSALSLPTHPRLTRKDIDYICVELMEALRLDRERA